MARLIQAVLAVLPFFFTLGADGGEYKAEVGQRAPEWELAHWMNGKERSLEEMRGKVVLVRWFTAEHCPYCSATAPALNEFRSTYGENGFEVVGIYHHKSSAPMVVEEVKRMVGRYGFTFPVAIDPEWRTLKRWWLFDEARKWTSVSFLLDREGKIAWIHAGGKYEKGDAAYAQLKGKIEELMGEGK